VRPRVLIVLSAVAAAVAFPGVAAADPSADLGVTATAPDTTTQDSDLSYEITVQNGGPDDAMDVALSDDVPANTTFVSMTQDSGPAFSCTTPSVGSGGTISCTALSLASGATAVFTLVVHVDPAAPRGQFLTDQAHLSESLPGDPNEENDTSSASTLVGPVTYADLGVQTLAAEAAGPDTDVSYTITMQNGGPDASDASLDDTLPGDMTFVSMTQTSGAPLSCSTPAVGSGGTMSCSTGSLAAGEVAEFTLVGHVPPATSSGTQYTNTATVTTTGATDPDSENDASTTTTTIGDADLGLTASGPPTAVTGSDLTYTITIANSGPDASQPATVTDTLPPHTHLVSFMQDNGPAFQLSAPPAGGTGVVSAQIETLSSGTSAQFTLVLGLDLDTPDGTLVDNSPSASATTFDPDSGNNSQTVTTTATVPRATVTSVSPSSGPAGTSVGVDGTNFDRATAVRFGGVPASSYVVDTAGHLTAVAPSGVTGTVDVRVQTGGGLSDVSAADRFTFVAPPAGSGSGGGEQQPSPDPGSGPIPPSPVARRLICGRVPELRRHTFKGALFILKRDSCHVKLRHKGHAHRLPSHVRKQSVKPGTPLYEGDTLRVILG
jgi:uncharacterized repeat protein (TIGR01451 family)